MKVLLLGDSIRQNYAPGVISILGDDFNVYEPNENCRFAKYLLRGLFDWEREMRDARIAHFNCGHWDLNNLFGDGPLTSLEEYGENVIRIAKILLSRHERVIFATTTPTTPDNKYNKNEVIIEFNEYIVPKLKELGVIINDLHALLYPDVMRYINNQDTIHLTDEGKAVCAEATAALIKRVAAELPEDPRENAGEDSPAGVGYAVII